MELRRVKELAVAEMQKHGLTDWKFRFSHARRQFGVCCYRQHEIKVSAPLAMLNDDSRVLNTIRHEVAHALAGFEHHHDGHWQRIAISIGCDGKRCVSVSEAVLIERPFVGTCPKCGTVVSGFKVPRNLSACRQCCRTYSCGRFNPEFAFSWARNPKALQQQTSLNEAIRKEVRGVRTPVKIAAPIPVVDVVGLRSENIKGVSLIYKVADGRFVGHYEIKGVTYDVNAKTKASLVSSVYHKIQKLGGVS